MNNDYWTPRNEDRREEKPPFSKIFILFSKEYDIQESELREAFEQFGDIENVFIPRERASNSRARGIAYVKYAKTSSAAAAIHGMNLKQLPNHSKPIKVLLATHRNDKNDDTAEKCSRLFIKVSKQAMEDEIKQHFSQFGELTSVVMLKDKTTQESKGLAYVNYTSFLDAAKAFENCGDQYKPVFATPKSELKRGRDSNDAFSDYLSNNHNRAESFTKLNNRPNNYPTKMTSTQNCYTVYVTCTPGLAQRHIERLFNIIPGMQQCQYSVDTYNGYCRAMITYDNENSAAHALEKLDNYEFPSGETLTVKPDDPLSTAADTLSTIVNSFKNAVDTGRPELLQLADVIAQASTLLKAATTGRADKQDQDSGYCSVPLPPLQPMAPPNSKVAMRCFLVFKPNPPPNNILKDALCRFGDLIDINVISNKTIGFAKYASERSAQAAIKTLHGATLCGVRMKVMEADDKPSKDNSGENMAQMDVDHDTETKRMRY